MNMVPAVFLAIIGWGLFFYSVRTDSVPTETINCADIEFERDSLKIENKRWVAIVGKND